VDELLERWLIVKHELQAAQSELTDIEDLILREMDEVKEEGSKTTRHGAYKITITGRVNRTFDEEKWLEIARDIPPHLRPVKAKTVLDEKGWKFLKEQHPQVASVVAQAVTEKQGKYGVKVEKE
jgi:hypothetical protein